MTRTRSLLGRRLREGGVGVAQRLGYRLGYTSSLWAILAVFSGLPLPAGDPPIPTELPLAIERYIRAEMKINDIPGLSVAAVRGFQAVHLKAFGTRNLASGDRMTVETPVDLASLSKSFTALAVWKLHQEGLLDVEAPVTKYLSAPGFAGHGAESITVHDLLRHTSGLPRRADRLLPCCDTSGAVGLDLAVLKLRPAAVSRPTGRPFEYTNSNYVLLAAIVESVSGESFPDYLRREIFEPLGMTRTTLDRGQAERWGLSAYHEQRWGRIQPTSEPFSGWWGSSGIKSTAVDMSRYARWMLFEGHRGFDGLLAAPGADSPPRFYDMGWNVTTRAGWLNGTRVLEHSGDIWGANTAIALAPELELGAVVLINLGAHRAEAIARASLRALAGFDLPSPAPTPWTKVPDNWALCFAAAVAFIAVYLAWYLVKVRGEFQRQERGFRWHKNWGAVVRAALLGGMATYMAEVSLGFSARPLSRFPTTMQTALPLLVAAVVALFLAHAVLSFAPRVRISARQGSRVPG